MSILNDRLVDFCFSQGLKREDAQLLIIKVRNTLQWEPYTKTELTNIIDRRWDYITHQVETVIKKQLDELCNTNSTTYERKHDGS